MTTTETIGWLLDRFAFAIQDFPDAQPTVADALGLVPAALTAEMAEQLAACRRAGGGWHWPPGGPVIPNPGPPQPWRVAAPSEADALDALAGLLRDRVGSG